MQEFDGRTAVVTGAASGIGRALAERFAQLGMNVVAADRDGEQLAQVGTLIAATGGRVRVVEVDVADQASVDLLAGEAVSTFGNVHVLCNNAGILRSAATWNQSLADAHAVMDVNFWGVMHGIRTFVPHMLVHGEPSHVVNTASFGGLAPLSAFSAYCASKFAVVALSETLVLDLAAAGHGSVGVSVLCPGGVETSIFATEARRRETYVDDATDRARFDQLADENRKGKYLPSTVADVVVDAIRDSRFYVIPAQAELRGMAERRLAALSDALSELRDLPVTQ